VSFEVPGVCQECGKGSFRLHGSYARTVVDADGVSRHLEIVRVRCTNRHCGVTHACLYSFLIPYRRHTAEIVASCIEGYLSSFTSYLKLAFGSLSGAMPDPSSVFRWLSVPLKQISLLVQQFQLACVDSGLDLPEGSAPCPNGVKVRTQEKRRSLGLGVHLLELARRVDVSPIRFLHEFFLRSAEICIACLSGRRNMRIYSWISSSHSMQCALF
jgi:hypothetical protein